jgi:TctA family transporter
MMDVINQFFANMAIGFDSAFSLNNLGFVTLGVVVGTFVGVLPGIGAITAISLLLPLTFHLNATSSLIMLSGIWYGSTFGGSITAVLLNIPGTPANAVTCIDGHALTKQGRGGAALLTAVMSSFIGGSIGIVVMMLFTAPIAHFALRFSSVEYFSLIVLGMVAASTISNESPLKGLAMVVIGIMIGTIGTDLYTETFRFTFGYLELVDGVGLVAVAMGVFGIAELVSSLKANVARVADHKSVRMSSMILTRDEVKRIQMPILRGSAIGSFLGALPGTGPAISAFMAYAVETRMSKDPSRFGHGAVEGVAAPESANNAADITAFIPTLSLGIPGSATMALMIGALTINGIAPGPNLMTSHPDLFWGLVVSFWIGSLILLLLSIPMIGVWVRLLMVPLRIMVPAILMFICIGTYSVDNSAFDIWLVAVLGLFGYFARILGFPAAPLILGFVLGPMLEEHFRRAMLISRGDFMIFVDHRVSMITLLITFALLVWGIWSGARDDKRIRDANQTREVADAGGSQ